MKVRGSGVGIADADADAAVLEEGAFCDEVEEDPATGM